MLFTVEDLIVDNPTNSFEERKIMILQGSPDYLYMIAEPEVQSKKQDALDYATVNIPTSCPRRCPQCALGDVTDAPETLTSSQRKGVVAKVSDAGAKFIVIIGNGEPLWQPTVSQGFEELVRPVIEKACVEGMGTIMFSTLSTAISDEQATILRDNNVSVIVSLHSLKTETYRQATGNGELCTVLANIEKLRSIYGENETIGDMEITRLGVNMTVTCLNQNQIVDVKQFSHDHGMQFICNPLMCQGLASRPKIWSSLVRSRANYLEQARLAEMHSDTGGQSSIRNGRCSYGFRGVAVDTNGTMMLCGYKSGPSGHMPNITTMTSKDLLRFHRQVIQTSWLQCETTSCVSCITRADTSTQTKLGERICKNLDLDAMRPRTMP